MTIWDGGFPDQPEDEREQAWRDSDDGDMPWDPNPVDKPQPWEDWPEGLAGPEYWLYRRWLREEGGDDTDAPS